MVGAAFVITVSQSAELHLAAPWKFSTAHSLLSEKANWLHSLKGAALNHRAVYPNSHWILAVTHIKTS